MGFRDISVCISSLESGFELLDQAAAIAEEWQAHLSCGVIGAQPPVHFTDGPMGGHSEYVAQAQASEEAIQTFRKRLKRHLEKSSRNIELRDTRVYDSMLAEAASVFARYSDLTIARMPSRPDRHRHGEIIEGALIGAGRPVLALPKNWKPAPLGRKIVFAWDASREASRAIHDALPMLASGAGVSVITIDADIGPAKHGAAPGLDIATHLARHGLKITVHNADSLGKTVGQRLVEAATDLAADMIVMGGYRHSKFVQRFAEGPTQFMISKSPVPIFMSH